MTHELTGKVTVNNNRKVNLKKEYSTIHNSKLKSNLTVTYKVLAKYYPQTTRIMAWLAEN